MRFPNLIIIANAQKATHHYFCVFWNINLFRPSPHFSYEPSAQFKCNKTKQFASRFKARFVIQLLHLTGKLEYVFINVQSVLDGSFSSYQFAHGDAL